MLKDLISRTALITFTRALGVSMSVIDIAILSYLSPNRLSAFAIAAQWIQVLVVACGSLGVGICVCVPKTDKKDRSAMLFSIVCLAVASGVFASACAASMSFLPMAEPGTDRLILCLAMGIIPLSLYACLGSFNQSDGCSRQILFITLIASAINAFLDIALIFWMSDAATAVALATTITWWFMGTTSMAYTIQRFNRYSTIWLNEAVARILKISLPDLFSKIGFVASITLYFWWFSFNLTPKELSDVMISSNYMNIAFIIFASASSAFSITFCENGDEGNGARYTRYAGAYCLVLLIFLLLLLPGFAYLYFGQISAYISTLLFFATLTVAIDGVSLFAITYLRINGLTTTPPYFRLILFPVMGAYYLVIDPLNALGVFEGMIAGNLIALGALGAAYQKAFRRPRQSDPTSFQ